MNKLLILVLIFLILSYIYINKKKDIVEGVCARSWNAYGPRSGISLQSMYNHNDTWAMCDKNKPICVNYTPGRRWGNCIGPPADTRNYIPAIEYKKLPGGKDCPGNDLYDGKTAYMGGPLSSCMAYCNQSDYCYGISYNRGSNPNYPYVNSRCAPKHKNNCKTAYSNNGYTYYKKVIRPPKPNPSPPPIPSKLRKKFENTHYSCNDPNYPYMSQDGKLCYSTNEYAKNNDGPCESWCTNNINYGKNCGDPKKKLCNNNGKEITKDELCELKVNGKCKRDFQYINKIKIDNDFTYIYTNLNKNGIKLDNNLINKYQENIKIKINIINKTKQYDGRWLIKTPLNPDGIYINSKNSKFFENATSIYYIMPLTKTMLKDLNSPIVFITNCIPGVNDNKLFDSINVKKEENSKKDKGSLKIGDNVPISNKKEKKCDKVKKFTPSNEFGPCSSSNKCNKLNWNIKNYNCEGIEQSPGNGACNKYCKQVGGGFYRSDLGGCVKNYCDCPTDTACKDKWFKTSCSKECNNMNQDDDTIISSSADSNSDIIKCKVSYGKHRNCNGDKVDPKYMCPKNRPKCLGASKNKLGQCQLHNMNSCDKTNEIKKCLIGRGILYIVPQENNYWWLPSWNSCNFNWSKTIGWGQYEPEKNNLVYNNLPWIGRDIQCNTAKEAAKDCKISFSTSNLGGVMLKKQDNEPRCKFKINKNCPKMAQKATNWFHDKYHGGPKPSTSYNCMKRYSDWITSCGTSNIDMIHDTCNGKRTQFNYDPTYIGCFKDNSSRNLKKGPVWNGGPYTSDKCKKACPFYKYIALQDGGACFCGNSYGKPRNKYGEVKPIECASSDKGWGFGGYWRNSIYKNNYYIGDPGWHNVPNVGWTYLDVVKDKRWILTAYGNGGNLGGLLNNNSGNFNSSRQNSAVRNFTSIFRKNGRMIISWSLSSSPSGRIIDYDYAIEILLDKNCNFSAKAVNPGIGSGSNRFSSSNPYIQNTKVRINVIKGNPNLPAYMYVRNSTFGAQYGKTYGLVSNEGAGNSQLDWDPDGQRFKVLYIGYKGGGSYYNLRGQRFRPRQIAIWYCYGDV